MLVHLRNGGTSLVLRQAGDTFEIVHWGAALPEVDEKSLAIAGRAVMHGALDVNPGNLILREHSRGWIGHPALRGHRSGKSVANWFVCKNVDAKSDQATITLEDKTAGLEISIQYLLDTHGILKINSKVTNIADGDYTLEHLLNWLPLAPQADEILDFYGHWTKERQPQRREIAYGLTTREGFEGRSGHD